MISQIGISTEGEIKRFQGKSADIKPEDGGEFGIIYSGSSFWELDTRKAYLYDRLNENPDTKKHWWEV